MLQNVESSIQGFCGNFVSLLPVTIWPWSIMKSLLLHDIVRALMHHPLCTLYSLTPLLESLASLHNMHTSQYCAVCSVLHNMACAGSVDMERWAKVCCHASYRWLLFTFSENTCLQHLPLSAWSRWLDRPGSLGSDQRGSDSHRAVRMGGLLYLDWVSWHGYHCYMPSNFVCVGCYHV